MAHLFGCQSNLPQDPGAELRGPRNGDVSGLYAVSRLDYSVCRGGMQYASVPVAAIPPAPSGTEVTRIVKFRQVRHFWQ